MLSSPIRCHDFVGRAAELDHLLGRRRDAGERRGGAVLVSGEAGIGKSRLIAEFVAASARSTARLVRAECREFAQSPFGPLADILSVLGERADFLRQAPSPEAQLEELLTTFSRIFERRATIVIVEDLHWASRELVQALRLLVARAETQRALFVVSYRDNEILPGHANFIPLGKLLRERAVSTIALARFDLNQTVGLLERALGADVRVPRVMLTDVARRSDGNPLYGEELLRHAVDGLGRPERARANAVPVSLHAIVRERVERCSPRERAALEMAALFGRDFDRDELRASGGEAAAPSEAELATLVRHQLLVFDELRGRYAFRHALTRDVMYAEIPERVAQPIHRRIAAALETREGTSATSIVEIAHHHYLGGNLARAAAPCEAAGALARAQFAYDECIRWYERALLAHGNDGAAVARVRLELGKVLVYAHELERGIAEYAAVAEWAQTREPGLFVRARKLIAGTIAADGRREAAIALLEATLATLGENAVLARELALRIASFVLLRDDPSEARATLALLEPAELGVEARAEFYRLRSDVHAHEPADDAAWRSDASHAIELYEQIGSTSFEHYTRVQFGWQALARGDVARARTSLETADRRSHESASTSNHLPITFAFVECAAGRFDAARAWLARVTAPQQLIERALEAVVRTELALALDEVAELERRLDLSLIGKLERADEARSAFRLGTAFGCALLRLDRRPEADRLFERVAPLARTTYEIVPGALALAAVRPDLSGPFLALLERGATTPFLTAAAAILRAEAECHAGGALEAAPLRDARVLYELAGWPALAARAAELEGDRAGAAQLYRAIGHVAGVRRLGLAAFRTAGAPALANDIESELSARELEVARCIATGTSNREAAATLSLSIKTIEKHLSSIYLKLGLHSRAQLAAYVAGARNSTPASR